MAQDKIGDCYCPMCNTYWNKHKKCKCAEVKIVGNKEDISHIARAVLAGDDSRNYISELAKLTAKQVYAQGYQAGEAARRYDVWNEAIEAAAKVCDTSKGYPTWNSEEIRKLKK